MVCRPVKSVMQILTQFSNYYVYGVFFRNSALSIHQMFRLKIMKWLKKKPKKTCTTCCVWAFHFCNLKMHFGDICELNIIIIIIIIIIIFIITINHPSIYQSINQSINNSINQSSHYYNYHHPHRHHRHQRRLPRRHHHHCRDKVACPYIMLRIMNNFAGWFDWISVVMKRNLLRLFRIEFHRRNATHHYRIQPKMTSKLLLILSITFQKYIVIRCIHSSPW